MGRLLFLDNSCIDPKWADLLFCEDQLLCGLLDLWNPVALHVPQEHRGILLFILNVSTGVELSIAELARTVVAPTGFAGSHRLCRQPLALPATPNGTPTGRMAVGATCSM